MDKMARVSSTNCKLWHALAAEKRVELIHHVNLTRVAGEASKMDKIVVPG
jgi:hypothetical protein